MKNKILSFLYFIVGFFRWLLLSNEQRKKLADVYDNAPDEKIDDINPALVLQQKNPNTRMIRRTRKSVFTKKHTRARLKTLQKIYFFDAITNKTYIKYVTH